MRNAVLSARFCFHERLDFCWRHMIMFPSLDVLEDRVCVCVCGGEEAPALDVKEGLG